MRAALGIVCAVFAAGAMATPHDGAYLPEEVSNGAMSCAAAGSPGAITSIAGDVLATMLFPCRLSNPVPVRGMDATLYDAACHADSEFGGGRVMLSRAGDRLLVHWGQYWEVWLKCD